MQVLHNKSVVWNLYCDQNSERQVSCGRNLRRLDKLVIAMIYTEHNY